MQRLYIGGLSHTVTQKDLKDRFGKFGDVLDVELRTRRDEEGVPYKTFGYINISISEANLKKCMTVLNKSKWKGGTLQIEAAKESFLTRLAEERQATTMQRLQQPAPEDKRQKMLDSLSSVGVDNFTMKAAVPGSEVPGHKDWVVSKFGRVLPILELRCQKGTKNRTMKYDPSKYCHNIRKLDRSTEDQPTPVSHLTWELQGGDDDISKKRRGEFPPYEPPKPKKRQVTTCNGQDAERINRFQPPVNAVHHIDSVNNGRHQSINLKPPQRRWALTGSDVDSDEEICRMVAAQDASHAALRQEVEEDNLEVVGLDYLAKFDRSSQQRNGHTEDVKENDYDSADTDELLASSKRPPQKRLTSPTMEDETDNFTKKKKKIKKKRKAEEEQDDSADEEQQITSKNHLSTQQKYQAAKQGKKIKISPVVEPSVSESGDDEAEETLDSDYSSESDYEALFSNVTQLEISFMDLQRLAEESEQNTASSSSSSFPKSQTGLAPKPTPKKGTTPEEILAALMEEGSSDEEQKKKKKKRKAAKSAPLPAFQGTTALYQGSENEERQEKEKELEVRGRTEVKKQKRGEEHSERSEEEEEEEEEDEKLSAKLAKSAEIRTNDSSPDDDDDDDEEQEEEEEDEKLSAKIANGADKSTINSSPDDDDDDDDDEQEEVEDEKLSAKPAKSAEIRTNDSSSDDDDDDEKEEEASRSGHILSAEVAETPSASLTKGDGEEPETKDAVRAAPLAAPCSESSSNEDDDDDDDDEQEEEPDEVMLAQARLPLKPEEEEELQKMANLRRLAAVQQRQKQTEEQKKLIQGALAKLDTPTAKAGKHIVFGSDDDVEEDEDDITEKKQETASEVPKSKKTLFEDSDSEDEASGDKKTANKKGATTEKAKQSGPQLFSGSEGEEEEDRDGEDDSRFNIRPQFEGPAGQKLMKLQSRFGTDERFRMDSRFLEDEEEDDKVESGKKRDVTEEEEVLEDEKMRTLSILQSVLGSSQQTSGNKLSSKAKAFKDVSALHYDPSREEHVAFETKTTEIKESKSARRKKREEALKLPEVSREIFYDVSGDLKAVFGQAKVEEVTQEGSAVWDQVEEEDEEEEDEEEEEEEEKEKEKEEGKEEQLAQAPPFLPADTEEKQDESSGFKFSFFGDDTDTGIAETEYKVESIQAPKVSWQQDPRFHDSSSEEDDEEPEEDEEQSIITSKTNEETTTSKSDMFFFFSAEDSRLSEGPKLFCRPSHLEEQREQWEEMRSMLRQEYRKKHKDARRRLKSSQKSS